MTTQPKKGRQMAIKRGGQPAPVWPQFMREAKDRIVRRGGWKPKADPVEQLAAEIIRHGEGEKFLKSCRRGRATVRQNIRYRLLRAVEAEVGAAVPRRREDRNTPEAARQLVTLKLEFARDPAIRYWVDEAKAGRLPK